MVALADQPWRPLGGGSICAVWRAATVDGDPVVVKDTPYDAAVEADGLAALAQAGAPVPEVLAVEPHRLVLAHVAGPPDWEGLGEALAAVHAHTGPSYGWHRDNLIGELTQPNARHEDWPTFFAEQRVRPFLDAPALPREVRARLERACAGPIADVLPADPPPSLIHGDLWAGNVVEGRWLIDPAVNHADRELELAFAALFGGLPEALWRSYQRAWPLAPGWQERRPVLQLYHLLVHVAHFGSGYVPAVVSRLDAVGW